MFWWISPISLIHSSCSVMSSRCTDAVWDTVWLTVMYKNKQVLTLTGLSWVSVFFCWPVTPAVQINNEGVTLLLDALCLLVTTRQRVPANCNIKECDDRHKSEINETRAEHFLVIRHTGSGKPDTRAGSKETSSFAAFFTFQEDTQGEICFCQVKLGSDPVAGASY